MKKKNSQPSRGGRSTNKEVAMTAVAAMTASGKNTHQNEVFDKFEALSLRDDRSVSDKSNATKRSDVTLRKKYQEETSAANSVSSKRQPKKTSRRSGGKKKGNNKNVLGEKQLKKAVVVEISEATVALDRKNKKKNLNSKKELVAAAQDDVENISAVHYGSYFAGVYPEHYYHDMGYYYQDSVYYQYYDFGYPYHYQYAPIAEQLPAPPALNIHAPVFEPSQHR